MRGATNEVPAKFALTLIVALGLAGGAHAVDGVIEINQVKALAGGITGTDGPGFPVSIGNVGSSGSYRLTSDLDVTVESNPEDVTAIEITRAHVTLDLNGFSIIGPGVVGTGRGVNAGESVTVINGTVRGMGDFGVNVSGGARIERLTVENNGNDGINVSVSSIVADNIVRNNVGVGIWAQDSIVRGNTVEQNGGDGIDANSDSIVMGNSVNGNGGDGIETTNNCTIKANTISGNTGFGLNAIAFYTGYTDNVIAGNNAAGTVSGGAGAVEIGTNLCGSNTTCP